MKVTPRVSNIVRAASLALVLVLATTLLAAAQGRVSGMVVDASDGLVTLDDGTSFWVTEDTRVALSSSATFVNLAVGQYVAITSARLPDGSLLASAIAVFPESQRGASGGQSERSGGDLMTNAHIEEARINRLDETELLVSFGEYTERVTLPATVRIIVRSDGSMDDVRPGVMIGANVTDGVASSITVEA